MMDVSGKTTTVSFSDTAKECILTGNSVIKGTTKWLKSASLNQKVEHYNKAISSNTNLSELSASEDEAESN